MLYHFAPAGATRIPLIDGIIGHGLLGVGFFFVLSGFVLVAVYAPRANRTGIELRKFYVARFARIYPVYVFALLLTVAQIGVKAHTFGGSPLRSIEVPLVLRLTMLSDWVPGYAIELNGPSWTLSVETFFYALFPFLLAWMLKARPGRRRLVALSLSALAGTVFSVVHYARPGAENMPPYAFVTFFPLLHLGSFLVGCEAGLLYVDRPFDREGPRRALSKVFVASLALLIVLFVVDRNRVIGIGNSGLLAVPFAAIVLWLAQNEERLSAFKSAPLVLLGEASFGAYILQFPVSSLVHLAAMRTHLVPEPGGGIAGAATFVVVLFLLSILIYGVLENPLRRILRALLEPKGSPEARSTASGIEIRTAQDPLRSDTLN